MIDFKPPQLLDKDSVKKCVEVADYWGSDANFANLYLLQKKYDTQISVQGEFLFRYYNGLATRRGYAFPLGNGNVKIALKNIIEDATQRGIPLEFALVDEPRKQILKEFFGDKISFIQNPGDSDYIYASEDLSTLKGANYRKKRNHYSKFSKIYSDFNIKLINENNIQDALNIENIWLSQEETSTNEDALAESSEDSSSRKKEYNAIVDALKYFKELDLKGAILYVQNKPVAMTIASETSPQIWDIHFEKVIGEYASNGGYTVINKLFAQSLNNAKFINREEDINLEGLRKAKLSYYPKVILKKYHGSLEQMNL